MPRSWQPPARPPSARRALRRAHSVSCDFSRGHSGSPIYHYRFSQIHGKDTPRVSAVVSWQNCQTYSASDDYPNHARRITPAVVGWISWLRETFP
ncbi:MAG: hypothetical protein KatS3mg053_0810 [Candidatus Roseilinea sp.]|nr:MAG: hypothetical protein KatS3mg053_0810 [Candidatus Roseilinea sp.]